MNLRTPDLIPESVLPTSGRLNRWIGLVVEAALSPHPVDRYLELVDPMLTWRDLRARVVEVTHPTPRTVRLRLRPTRQWQGHHAGQFVQVSVVINGVRHMRCFSPANAATGPAGDIELTVTAHDGGFVSRHLATATKAGDVIGLSQAQGEFVLPRHEPSSVVFISGGSGVTPVLSMARTLLTDGYTKPVVFVHYAPTRADVSYRSELAALAAVHPNLDLRTLYTRGERATEHFTADHLDAVADLTDAEVFVCGPAALMEAVADFHESAGFISPLHSEAFTVAAPIEIDPNQPVTGELAFLSSGKTATNDGRTLLDQAESAGLSPKSGCRMGICFSCTSTKLSGCTRNVLTGEIDSEGDKQIQLCINAPVGDVDIAI